MNFSDLDVSLDGYSQAFLLCLEDVLSIEGGYVNHRNDPETKWGITINKARAYGYNGAMEHLEIETAIQIYHQDYWVHERARIDRIHKLAGMRLAKETLEYGINTSPHGGEAIRAMQKALNALCEDGRHWDKLAVDGYHGPRTHTALKRALSVYGDADVILTKAINAIQGAHYIDIATQNPELQPFVRGWIKRRV